MLAVWEASPDQVKLLAMGCGARGGRAEEAMLRSSEAVRSRLPWLGSSASSPGSFSGSFDGELPLRCTGAACFVLPAKG